MNERMQDRLFAGCGIASVLLQLVGAAIATVGGKTHNLTISSTATHIAHAVAKPAGTAVWIGAYLELLGVGAFLAFAVWASVKLGGGLLGAIGQTAAAGYATLLASSLAVAAALAHRAGHGISVQLATTLVTVTEALYVGTWFMTAFFLLAVGALAVSRARRALGWSAIGIAIATLAATAISVETVGQFTVLLSFAWIAFASIAIARGERVLGGIGAVAQSA